MKQLHPCLDGLFFFLLSTNNGKRKQEMRLLTCLAKPTPVQMELLGSKLGQRAMPLIIDPGLYQTTKSDIFWVTPRRTLPTAFKLFTAFQIGSCDFQIGGVYDPSRDRFDHHQKGFNEVFGHGLFTTKLSSAGLVYKHYGVEIIAKEIQLDEGHPDVCRLYLAIYKSFIELLSLKSFHVRLMSIVLDVDVEPTTTPWDSAKEKIVFDEDIGQDKR